MNILFDIGHPAQVHNFKHVANTLDSLGHKILFTAKNKDITFDLLEKLNFNYVDIGSSKKGLFNKIIAIPITCFNFYKVIRNFKPKIVISRG